MLQTDQIEELITVVSTLDKEALLQQFAAYPATFPIDFNRDFLNGQSVDRLRHLFLAVCLQSKRMPSVVAEEEFVAA
jgi:hypothetical protein